MQQLERIQFHHPSALSGGRGVPPAIHLAAHSSIHRKGMRKRLRMPGLSGGLPLVYIVYSRKKNMWAIPFDPRPDFPQCAY